MNSQFKVKFLQQLANKKGTKGFTLIELLVVVIIIGVLAAIALPNLLGQVAKGRQSEAKNNLGAINRAQQGYRLEKGTFGSIGDGTTGTVPLKVSGEYYDFGDVGTANAVGSSHEANAKSTYGNDINEYASAVGQTDTGTFTAVVCESEDPNSDAAATAGTTTGAAVCPTGSNEVN